MDRDTLLREVEKVREVVYDYDARFSRPQMLENLRDLLKNAEKIGGAPATERDLLLMIGLIESKGGTPQDVTEALSRALKITAEPPLTEERLARTHVLLGDNFKDAGEYARAAEHYAASIGHMAKSREFTEDNRLGIGQDLGYVLNEAQKYQAALDNNIAVLSGGEKLHGTESPLLRSVITNIAQNLHALDRKAEAEPYLLRALALARADEREWNEQDLMFQLGVLAFELGDNEKARRFMQDRLAFVKRINREDLIEAATEDLEVLEDKIKTGRK
jgi:tetratricopeptide (TPR) repeat protein